MIKLRPWRMEDLENLVKYANNWNISKNMTDKFPFPYTTEKGISFIEQANRMTPTNIFAIEYESEAIGGIGIHPQEDIQRMNAELGYWLAEPFWGKGIISQAIAQMIDYSFQNFEINRIFARPFGTNDASQRVLEKNNFILEAKFEKTLIKNGELVDELVYAVRKENWQLTKKSVVKKT